MKSTLVYVCAAALVLTASVAVAKPVVVNVWYESLCPDSIRFVTQVLTPAFNALGEEAMLVDFIPYGKATTTPTTTGFSFRCQHGASECRGNKLQACALSRLSGNIKKHVQFVNCVMSASNPSRPSDKCASDVGLDASELQTCASGREGETLLAAMGERTPKHIAFVPTIGLNWEVDQSLQDQALRNLKDVVCDKLEASERPSACDRKASWFFW